MSLKPLKKALQLKPPRTRSRTEMSCPEAGVSQGPDEIAESEAEAISREVNETRSPECNSLNIILCIRNNTV